MKVQCSKCESKYTIKDEKIPDSGAKLKCPECQHIINVVKTEPEPLALSESDLEQIPNPKDGVPLPGSIICQSCSKSVHEAAAKCDHCGSVFFNSNDAFNKSKSGSIDGLLVNIPLIAAAFMLWISYIGPYDTYVNHILYYFTISCLSVPLLTAVLASYEAYKLKYNNTSSIVGITNPVSVFFGMIFLWIVVYPYYLYLRSKMGKKNLLVYGAITAIIFVASGISMANRVDLIGGSDVALVKNGILKNYPKKKIGDAIDGFMGNPKWEAITATDGNPYVNVKGKILYDGKESSAAIQFRIYKESDTFEINSFEINGKPANKFVLWELLEKMYASSGDYHGYASEQQHNYPDESAHNRALDAAISELNGRESLIWADVKISENGYTTDTEVVSWMDKNLGDDYIWIEEPNKRGGRLKYKDTSVVLQRTPSTTESPAVWYKK